MYALYSKSYFPSFPDLIIMYGRCRLKQISVESQTKLNCQSISWEMNTNINRKHVRASCREGTTQRHHTPAPASHHSHPYHIFLTLHLSSRTPYSPFNSVLVTLRPPYLALHCPLDHAPHALIIPPPPCHTLSTYQYCFSHINSLSLLPLPLLLSTRECFGFIVSILRTPASCWLNSSEVVCLHDLIPVTASPGKCDSYFIFILFDGWAESFQLHLSVMYLILSIFILFMCTT